MGVKLRLSDGDKSRNLIAKLVVLFTIQNDVYKSETWATVTACFSTIGNPWLVDNIFGGALITLRLSMAT